MASVTGPPPPPVDFAAYADPERLGDGEARERLLKLQSDMRLAEQELQLASNNLEGTQRLAEKDFVTQQELEADEMQVRKQRSAAEAADIAVDLFIRYEFPKQAEKLLSDYEEALRKLERVRKEAVSKLAQAEARMKSTEAKYQLQKRQRDEYEEQLDKCVIVAERPGLVVYAGGNNRYRRSDPIEPGVNVREHQEIITIPDMTEMAVEVKIHESAVKQVERGQKARVRLDAFPDRVLDGEIVKLSVLPDSGRRWMNPDLKLYPATVSIDGVHDWLKPGMSAEVEILVTELKDVVYVPLQAVSTHNDERVVYVARAVGAPERRVVETGDFNDEFIEVRAGLEAGEAVMLRAPKTTDTPAGEEPEQDAPQVAQAAGATDG
jgi:RND family efflux transporter MFP subunit